MKVHKVEAFKKENPETSVIIPSLKGEASPSVQRLITELKKQTYQNFELLVTEDIRPNGRARNEAVKEASGRFLIFIDDTSSLPQEKVIQTLLEPFLEKSKIPLSIGASGASLHLHPGIGGIQKQYWFARNFQSPTVSEWMQSDQVQHACMAIPKDVYEKVGQESDLLITGTDNDLRARITRAGYKMMLAPNTWVHHIPPASFKDLLRKSFVKGEGSVYAFLIFPGLFDQPSFLGKEVTQPVPALLYKIASTFAKLVQPEFLRRPFALLMEWVVMAGYVYGWFKWRGKPAVDNRQDLPGNQK